MSLSLIDSFSNTDDLTYIEPFVASYPGGWLSRSHSFTFKKLLFLDISFETGIIELHVSELTANRKVVDVIK